MSENHALSYLRLKNISMKNDKNDQVSPLKRQVSDLNKIGDTENELCDRDKNLFSS